MPPVAQPTLPHKPIIFFFKEKWNPNNWFQVEMDIFLSCCISHKDVLKYIHIKKEKKTINRFIALYLYRVHAKHKRSVKTLHLSACHISFKHVTTIEAFLCVWQWKTLPCRFLQFGLNLFIVCIHVGTPIIKQYFISNWSKFSQYIVFTVIMLAIIRNLYRTFKTQLKGK